MKPQPLPPEPPNGPVPPLIVRRAVPATPERVFAAWTDPDELVHWWGPEGVRCSSAEVDLRPGGAYRIGNVLPDGRLLWIEGRFEHVERPNVLIYSWKSRPDSASGPAPGEPERVIVRFLPDGEGTLLEIEHQRITNADTRDRHEEGWAGCLDGLSARLAEAR